MTGEKKNYHNCRKSPRMFNKNPIKINLLIKLLSVFHIVVFLTSCKNYALKFPKSYNSIF